MDFFRIKKFHLHHKGFSLDESILFILFLAGLRFIGLKFLCPSVPNIQSARQQAANRSNQRERRNYRKKTLGLATISFILPYRDHVQPISLRKNLLATLRQAISA